MIGLNREIPKTCFECPCFATYAIDKEGNSNIQYLIRYCQAANQPLLNIEWDREESVPSIWMEFSKPQRFPQYIRLFTVSKDEQLLGGTVLYITQQVVHTQYISASEEGKRLRAIDLLFDELLHHRQWNRPYFDFGTSNEEDGRILVEPLIYQKEGFGGRGICYDTYEWEV